MKLNTFHNANFYYNSSDLSAGEVDNIVLSKVPGSSPARVHVLFLLVWRRIFSLFSSLSSSSSLTVHNSIQYTLPCRLSRSLPVRVSAPHPSVHFQRFMHICHHHFAVNTKSRTNQKWHHFACKISPVLQGGSSPPSPLHLRVRLEFISVCVCCVCMCAPLPFPSPPLPSRCPRRVHARIIVPTRCRQQWLS